jgi:ABC-type Fe3+ transport system permease subunit
MVSSGTAAFVALYLGFGTAVLAAALARAEKRERQRQAATQTDRQADPPWTTSSS